MLPLQCNPPQTPFPHHPFLLPAAFLTISAAFTVLNRSHCYRHPRLRCHLRLCLALPPPFKIINPTWKTHATPAATLREITPTPQLWKVISVWLLSLLHPPPLQNLHSTKSKSFHPLTLLIQKIRKHYTVKKYKPITKKVCLVIGQLPEKFHIKHKIISNPLNDLPNTQSQSTAIHTYWLIYPWATTLA
jgi:hypothetical protein